jgi:hypothetical protein
MKSHNRIFQAAPGCNDYGEELGITWFFSPMRSSFGTSWDYEDLPAS